MAASLGEACKLPREAKRVAGLKKKRERGGKGKGKGVVRGGGVGEGDVVRF